MKRILLLAAAPLLLPAAAIAQTMAPATAVPATVAGSTTATLSVQDAHFVKMAAISGMAEVNDGQLAAKMGATATVRNLGSKMVADHTAANNQLMAIAQKEGATVPAMVDAPHAAMSAKLKMLSGGAFDKQYLHDQLLGHEQAIALFKAEAATGSDPALKSFASTTLPTLQQHLAMIKAAMA